ncbi:MAG: hypothetical protein KGL48_00570 [Sphingomonadales bacterium]|nr:hypothetical protein [Sphingomonadales bacterium]MDE2567857.1 hypothetical protein [Sphingomonadales bacterium]
MNRPVIRPHLSHERELAVTSLSCRNRSGKQHRAQLIANMERPDYSNSPIRDRIRAKAVPGLVALAVASPRQPFNQAIKGLCRQGGAARAGGVMTGNDSIEQFGRAARAA